MAAYGLIGYPLGHSFSPAYFARKFAEMKMDATYTAFPLPAITLFQQWLHEHANISGFNVTIPYKESIFQFLDELDPTAQAIGAVNCVSVRGKVLKGYNTDAPAFRESLEPLLEAQHDAALILGTGGASRAVAYALQQLGIQFQKVSRTYAPGRLTYETLTPELIATHKLIINATPLGKFPEVDEYPGIDYSAITSKHLLYDLIYNPEETRFLSYGKQRGAKIKNGYEMLIRQADASLDIWLRS